jgi:hypothetical protein
VGWTVEGVATLGGFVVDGLDGDRTRRDSGGEGGVEVYRVEGEREHRGPLKIAGYTLGCAWSVLVGCRRYNMVGRLEPGSLMDRNGSGASPAKGWLFRSQVDSTACHSLGKVDSVIEHSLDSLPHGCVLFAVRGIQRSSAWAWLPFKYYAGGCLNICFRVTG